MKKPSLWQRFISLFSDGKRSYDGATGGRRSDGWRRDSGDVNRVIKMAGRDLRNHSRDLVRNVGWARRGQHVIANNTVGWGLVPKLDNPPPKFSDAWKAWIEGTDCDADGRLNFVGLQHLVMTSCFTDGEVLIRRRTRLASDGLPLPLQLQVLEVDFLDTSKDDETSAAGGKIIGGVEFDKLGRRAAYWLFPEHPGSNALRTGISKRVPASEIFHAFVLERPGQVRGVSWLAAAILTLKDLDEYEDAELMKQKIAACFAAYVIDSDGAPMAEPNTTAGRELEETIEPGTLTRLRGGEDVKVANPPQVTVDNFTTRNLRRIAASLGLSYEDLTGDYSNVNFSSAKMGRLVHQGYVANWQTNLLTPFCRRVLAWAMEAGQIAGMLPAPVSATWTPPALPMLEPDKDARANILRVRGGQATPSEIVREQGYDPDEFFAEYAADVAKLRALGLWFDSDVELVSAAGLTQSSSAAGGGDPPADPPKAPAKAPRVQVVSTDPAADEAPRLEIVARDSDPVIK